MLAALAALAADAGLLGVRGPWKVLERRVARQHHLERGVVQDRLQIRSLLDAPADLAKVVVAGSSRANAGFRPKALDRNELGKIAYGKLAHAWISPFEIRSMVAELLEVQPDVVVLVLSEFDLNRPLMIAPQASFGSWSAIADLIAEAGISFSLEHRLTLYRLAMASLLDSYRFRQVLQRAFADDLRRFPLDERFPESPPPPLEPLTPEGPRTPLTADQEQQIFRRLAELFPDNPQAGPLGYGWVRRITRGDHARVHQGLLRRAVERLSRAGIRVVICEAPLHPIAAELYDTTIRGDFLEFVDRLERQFAIRFIPLEASGPFKAEDFADLTHLRLTPGGGGAQELSRTINATVQELLASDLDGEERAPGTARARALREAS